MRAYPLSSLVSLRERRVDEAQNALRLSISRLEEARLSLKRKEQELSDYKVVYAMVIIMTLNLLSILLSIYILPKF